MKKILLSRPSTRLLIVFTAIIILGATRWIFGSSNTPEEVPITTPRHSSPINIDGIEIVKYRRQACSCSRPIIAFERNLLVVDETASSFCSQYATFRGFHQRVISISMYGPKENSLFNFKTSFNFLHELIKEIKLIYPGWVLRIYHDESIKENIICPIECEHNHVDFCNASELISLGSVSRFMPPKIWRFLPASDKLVDIMCSRDLDSPLAQRELDAVNEWLSTDKQWHVMRDHPQHTVPMLGGLWGFRPELNRTMARILLEKILNPELIKQYVGRADQTFLSDHIWPIIQDHVLVHDSYLCTTPYGKNSKPWPTRRPPLNATGCFAGCIRPCCKVISHPFGECPLACRPKQHADWTMC